MIETTIVDFPKNPMSVLERALIEPFIISGAGACCYPDGTCLIKTSAECTNEGGIYQGDKIPCSPNPCLAFSCPHDAFLCVIFNSIVSCGCSGTHEMIDISMNGTFSLSKVVDSGDTVDWQGKGGFVHVRQYESDSCSGAIISESDIQLDIELVCDVSSGYTLNYSFNFGGFFLVFEAFNAPGEGSIPTGIAVPNQATCGGIRIGTAGTVIVNLGPC